MLPATLPPLHAAMLQKLGAQEGRIEAAFGFFLRKRAPVSGVQSLLEYQGRWIAETRAGSTTLWAEVAVPVKSLCPCSKEISDYGAHNQRSLVTVRVELLQSIEWHELVRFAEDAASCEIWPMLKRADEKWVEYLEYCDRFYFAVPEEFPQEALPAEHGLIVADRFGAAVVRESGRANVAGARRKALLIRFARCAAERLVRVSDPFAP